jgi:hypothetical protein
MAKKLNIVNPIDDDENGEEQPLLDTTKPLGVQATARTFGKVDLPDAGRQVAKPIALSQIVPDPAQPRRAIPLSVRRAAREYQMPEWEAWYRLAEHLSGHEINLLALLQGHDEPAEEDPNRGPLVDAFMDLVALAASIYRDRLTNPISLIHIGPDRYQIETGERRWLAHVMLHDVLGTEQFSKIAAHVVEKANVWKQASENSARRPLNAIGTARQLSLLLMDLYRNRDGIHLLDYQEMIPDGECDRAFYAQVADGNVYRVPKGFGERILQASGLKSKAQLSQYRDLLDLPDDLWMQADEEDWPERRIREELEMSTKSEDRLTMVNLSSKTARPLELQDTDITQVMRKLEKFWQRDPLTYKPRDKTAILEYAAQVQAWLDELVAKTK